MATLSYACLFAKNYDTKKKTWRDGLLSVQQTVRFLRVSLYAVEEDNRVLGTPIDVFDIFNYKYDELAGEVVSSGRFIVRIFEVKKNMKNRIYAHHMKVKRNANLLGNKEKQRVPALGTCRAFTKYRISEGGVKNNSPPSYNVKQNGALAGGMYGQVSSDRSLHPMTGDGSHWMGHSLSPHKGISDSNSKGTHSGYMSASVQSPKRFTDTREHYKTANAYSSSSWERNTSTAPMKPNYMPRSLDQAVVTGNYNQTRSKTAGGLLSPLKHGNSSNIEKKAIAPETYNMETIPGEDLINFSICDNIIGDTIAPAAESVTAEEGEQAAIVDSALIDCIESALDQFGDLTSDM